MSYFLLDRRNSYGEHWYPTRNGRVKAIVVHATAGLEDQDLVGPDHSAENTARYAATTDRKVSWHSGSDTDTFLDLLPWSYTAWHCQGYNSSTYGHEISKKDMSWSDEPTVWVTRTLTVAATGLRVRAAQMGVPVRRATRAELDRAIATDGPPVGFVSHAELDPARRTDPGRDFPWPRFLDLMRTASKKDDDMFSDKDRAVLQYLPEQLKNVHWLIGLWAQREQARDAALLAALKEQGVNVQGAVDRETAQIDAQIQEVLTKLSAASPVDTGPVPILGPASLKPLDAAVRAQELGATRWYQDAIPWLYQAGHDTGVDFAVLAAQCAWETGWGRFGGAITPEHNNTCGLKVRSPAGDRPEDHARFPDLQTGALAHAHHIAAYAGREAPADTPDPRYVWVGPGTPNFGSATTVEELGGKWAPDPEYGVKVAAIVRRLRGQ